jgi:VanZ family protein
MLNRSIYLTGNAFMLISVWRTMLGTWLGAVLLVISLPWSKFDARPHWENVRLLPLHDLTLDPTIWVEYALNILAFVPVGYLAVRSASQRSRKPMVAALLLGLCSSVGIEVYELFCQDRVPSTTDILTNVGGTGIGVWLACAIDQVLAFFNLKARRLPA